MGAVLDTYNRQCQSNDEDTTVGLFYYKSQCVENYGGKLFSVVIFSDIIINLSISELLLSLSLHSVSLFFSMEGDLLGGSRGQSHSRGTYN